MTGDSVIGTDQDDSAGDATDDSDRYKSRGRGNITKLDLKKTS